MASSDDFPVDDVWSSALREELFPEDNLRSFTWGDDTRTHSQTLPPLRPSLPSANPTSQQTFIQQQQHRLHNPESFNPPTSHFSASAPLQRKRSQFELPNFPLATDPTGVPSNSSGRPPFSSASAQRPAQIPTPPSITHPISAPRSASPSSSSHSLSPSETSDSDSSEDENLNRFVDLTQESSPPTMPPVREKRGRNALRSSLSEQLAEDSPNPVKRRKTGAEASQSSQRPRTIEEVDLRDVDNDAGLSRVLEQQRKATIAAQQEQASKPVKLSTLQCIICMEPMKVVTATHCGKLWFALGLG